MTDFSVSGSHTIIGAVRFHGRVRDGVGWFPHAEVAKRKGVVGATPPDSQGGAGLKGGSGSGSKLRSRSRSRSRSSRRRRGASARSGWVLADQAARSISTGRLHASRRVHRPPIHVVVSHGPSGVSRTRERSSWGGLPA